MKLLSFTLLLIAFGTLLVYTNPTMDEYSAFIGHQIMSNSDSSNAQSGVLNSVLSSAAGAMAAGTTTRRNFVFFSIYTTTSGPRKQQCIGVLENFVACRKPASTRK